MASKRSQFEDASLAAAFDRAVKNAKHLRAVHAPTVKAARMLARKIDAWDVIVDWALEDADGNGRPSVPANDNVSLASFLKYMDVLGMTPPAPAKAVPGASAVPAAPVSPRDQVAAMRAKIRSS